MSDKFATQILRMLIVAHTLLFIVGVFGLFLIFFKSLQKFFAIFFLITIGSEIVFLANCPLTLLEDKLRSKLKMKSEESFFINRILNQYLALTLPERFINFVLIIYFAFSLYLIINKIT